MTGASLQIVGGTRSRPGARCEIVTDFSRLEQLSDEWQRLVLDDPVSDVFRHWNWVRAFYTAYAAELELRVLVVRRDDRTIGFLPLVQRGRTLEFLGALESDYNDLVSEDGAAPLVLETALETLLSPDGPHGWDTLALDNLPAASRIVSSLPLLPPRLRRHAQQLPQFPSLTVDFASNRAEVLDALLRKEQPRRSERKLQKAGRVALRHIEAREEAREHLAIFFRQHIQRCAVNGMRSQFLTPQRRAFYEAMVEHCDLTRELRFAVLEWDGRPLAYHFGLQFHGKFVWYKPSFDVDYWEFSPGDVLLRHLFRYAVESDLREFDFSVGDEPYKKRFANRAKPNYAVYVERCPRALRSQASCALRYCASAARRQPAVLRLCRGAKDAAQRLNDTRPRELLGRLGAWYRRNIWACERVFFFSLPAAPADVPGVEIAPASLSTLASMSVEYPREFNGERLSWSRFRLKHGDCAFLGRAPDGRVALLWTSRRSDLVAAPVGPECRLPLEQPVLFVSEWWMPAGDSMPPAALLSALAARCGAGELWIYCLGRHAGQHRAITASGVPLRFRLSYRALLRRFRRIEVEACAAPPQAAGAVITGVSDARS